MQEVTRDFEPILTICLTDQKSLMGTSILNSATKARIFFGQPNFSNDARGYAFKGKDLNLKNRI